jgi:hypothetical protein
MRPPKRYKAAPAIVEDDLVPFVIEGVNADGSPWTEEFMALPKAPPGVLFDLVNAVGLAENGQMVYSAQAIGAFMSAVLHPTWNNQVERWERLMRDPFRTVDVQVLGQIMMDLAEEVGGFPTTPPASSAGGSWPAGGTSPAGSSSPAMIPTTPTT